MGFVVVIFQENGSVTVMVLVCVPQDIIISMVYANNVVPYARIANHSFNVSLVSPFSIREF